MRTIQIPDDLYQRAAEMANTDQVSVDRLIVALVSEYVAEWTRLQSRASRGSLDKLKKVLDKVGDSPASPEDRL